VNSLLHIYIKISVSVIHVNTINSDGKHKSLLKSCSEVAWAFKVESTLIEVDVLLLNCPEESSGEYSDKYNDQQD
jgi:hypothetical protein